MTRSRFLIVSLVVGLWVLSPARAAEPDVRIVKHQATWELAYGVVLFRVVGEVENVSTEPVPYIRMEVDVLGPDEEATLELVTYNQRAEPLATVEDEEEAKRFLDSVEPLEPGSTDSFRIGVAKDDFPKGARLAGYRVHLLEPSGETVTEFAAPKGADDFTNLNTATKEELLALPEMNESRAAAVIRHRDTHGALIHPAELQAIPQVAPVWEQLAPHVTAH